MCRGVDCNFAVTVSHLITHYIHTQWLDEDDDAIALSSDSEVAEAMEIAAKNGSSLVIQGATFLPLC